MYKQSPNRGHRSKGIKVKHILQICLLLAVCFWLIYQVKHSHEKRKEFDTKDENIVGKSDSEILRFGRKDLPRATEIATDVEKHGEDEEEKENEEEENKHEEDEPEREDTRTGERAEEDGGREGGDDELDDKEPEKTDPEPEHEEEIVQDYKERRENEEGAEENRTENAENEDVAEEDRRESEENKDAKKEDHNEREENEDVGKEDDGALDDHDRDGGSTNTREAREEQYKADDASSEVAHDIQTENVTVRHANAIWGKVNFGQENETKTSDETHAVIKSEVQPTEVDMNNVGTSSNVTVNEQKKLEVNLTKPDDNLLHDSTLQSLLSDQEENRSNSTAVSAEDSGPLSNGTQIGFDSNLSWNTTEDGTSGDKEPNLLGNVLERSNKSEQVADDKSHSEAVAGSDETEYVNTNAGESVGPSNTTLASSHKANGRDDKIQTEKLENSGTSKSDESLTESHYSDEGIDVIHHDPIDTSDTTLTQEEKESRTDFDTLPEIRTEAQNTEDVTAE